MTDPVGAKLLDDLIVLFEHHRNDRWSYVVQESLEYIKQASREHSEQPVTLSLCRIFDQEDPGWRSNDGRTSKRNNTTANASRHKRMDGRPSQQR